MKRNPLRSLLMLVFLTISIFGTSVPVYAWKYDSEYSQVVSERDQARRDLAEEVQRHMGDLKAGNPATDKQIDGFRQQLEDARKSMAAALVRTEAEQQRSGRWESIALGGTLLCFLLGGIIGLAIGAKARRDHLVQQTVPAGEDAGIKE